MKKLKLFLKRLNKVITDLDYDSDFATVVLRIYHDSTYEFTLEHESCFYCDFIFNIDGFIVGSRAEIDESDTEAIEKIEDGIMEFLNNNIDLLKSILGEP